jgi:hypothetical protein
MQSTTLTQVAMFGKYVGEIKFNGEGATTST